jgi:hypothetical protein
VIEINFVINGMTQKKEKKKNIEMKQPRMYDENQSNYVERRLNSNYACFIFSFFATQSTS